MKIYININGKPTELTVSEARRIWRELDEFFGPGSEKNTPKLPPPPIRPFEQPWAPLPDTHPWPDTGNPSPGFPHGPTITWCLK